MFTLIYKTLFFKPLYNILVFLTAIMPFNDFGLAIIVLTCIVRLVILPFTHRSTVTQRKMKEIEPEISKVKEKYKHNKQEQTKKTMELYKAHGISPFSGFLMLLIQLPILFALFYILKDGISLMPDNIYSFVAYPEHIKTSFLGIIDMAKPNYILAILAGVSQFLQTHFSMPKTPKVPKGQKQSSSFSGEFQKSMAVQMKYVMPAFILFAALRFSSGIALYWTISNVFAIVHEIIVGKKAKKIYNNGTDTNNQANNRGNASKDGNRV